MLSQLQSAKEEDILTFLLSKAVEIGAHHGFPTRCSFAIEGLPTKNDPLVHVCQGEYAVVNPNVKFVGTDEMTTCVGVAIRDPSSKRTALGHMDAPDSVRTGLRAMEATLAASGSAPVEVHLVGGYNDTASAPEHEHDMEEVPEQSKRTAPKLKCSHSWPLICSIFNELKRSKSDFVLRTLLLWDANTTSGPSGHPLPQCRAFWIDTGSGVCFPAPSFTEDQRQPDPVMRYAVVCALRKQQGSGLVSLYSAEEDAFVIPRVRLSQDTSAPFWRRAMALSDEEILHHFSTSPFAEGPTFVASMRSLFQLYAQDANGGSSAFRKRDFLRYSRARDGTWRNLDSETHALSSTK